MSAKAKARSDAMKGEYKPPHKGFFGSIAWGTSDTGRKRYHEYTEAYREKRREMEKKK